MSMKNTRIIVQGWSIEGPTHSIERRNVGWRNRRNRYTTQQVGDAAGESYDKPDYHVAEFFGTQIAALFNRGFEYEVSVSVDGSDEELPVHVDATHGYHTIHLPEGIEITDVSIVGVEDEGSPPADDEATAPEEGKLEAAGDDRDVSLAAE